MTYEDRLMAELNRIGKEPSKALPQSAYRDPFKSVRYEKERQMSEGELDAYCWAWNRWCHSKRFFLTPGAKNILARMQPSKVRLPPDAPLSEEMAYFNMAIHALADMEDQDAGCFIKFYADVEQEKLPIKTIADKMKIGVRTFYDRKSRFARKALSMAASLKRAHVAGLHELSKDSGEIVD